MKKGIKGIIAGLIITMSLGMTAATGCSAKQAPAATATEQVTVTCDWDKVNSALDKYDFGKTFYLESDYKDDEKAIGSVSIVNYDPASAKAFREVPCQIMSPTERPLNSRKTARTTPPP